MALPLEGIRVLDMTVFQQGPYSTVMLGDLGADVIKIEGPDSPDPGRFSIAVKGGPLNAYFQAHNRSKRSLVIDLKNDEGRKTFYKLVEQADVFVSNLRRPALARLGCDYETLSKINPRLIYARASGYGPKGPDADRAAMDILGQARGGIMSVTGDPDGPPKPVGAAVGDHVGAMSLAFGIMVALYHRERTGEGQALDSSLLSGQLCIQSYNITDYLWGAPVQQRRPRVGYNAAWSAYQGSDGKWFAVGMNKDWYWEPFCRTIGRPELIANERYATLKLRLENYQELFEIFDAHFATRPAAEWVKMFADADLLACFLNDYSTLVEDPQVVENGYITEVEGTEGVKMVGPPVQFSKTPGKARSLAPEFGQHTEEVPQEAGLDWDDITRLRSVGAIGPRA
jgi:crotonobetainyl-CoA:carnitine CoA-transferase CaiB-like acyl-CoA transferase